jgi:hydrogenase/urease accessory protein HupE
LTLYDLVLFACLAFLVLLPLYLVLGVICRFSVLAGYPVNEVKNKKWRMGFLLTFAVLGVAGIILGIAGMGNARHFRDAHGVSPSSFHPSIHPSIFLEMKRVLTQTRSQA